jgi:hypothetical protein
MSKFMLSMGLVLASLVGMSAAGYGAPTAAVAKGDVAMAAAEFSPDGPYFLMGDAQRDALARSDQGFFTRIVEDANGYFWVYYG